MADPYARAPTSQTASPSAAAHSLDYDFFKTRVEPVFLKHRPGHARCYGCHSDDGQGSYTAFHLEVLSPGKDSWTEEQSRRNFEVVSHLINPGDPPKSRLLTHPLSLPEDLHRGGKQFASQEDPDWLTLAKWARGEKEKSTRQK